MLDTAKKIGYAPTGVELSSKLSKVARNKGHEVLNTNINEYNIDRKYQFYLNNEIEESFADFLNNPNENSLDNYIEISSNNSKDLKVILSEEVENICTEYYC